MTPKAKWKVSLSNGETFYEDKGNFKALPGELSPWQRLLLYLQEKNVNITYLGLYSDDNKTWNLPSSGRNPKFSMFSKTKKPINYRMFRTSAMDISLTGGKSASENYTVIESEYENMFLQIWVSEEDINNCWSAIIMKDV